MQLNEMKTGVRYLVTCGSDCGTLQQGDHIRLLSTGDILCSEAAGWIETQNVKELHGVEVEIDYEWIERRRIKLINELDVLDTMEGINA